jgi:hypothetical protein
MIFGDSASFGWRMAARTVLLDKKNSGGDQIDVVVLVWVIALTPASQHAQATYRARLDPAKHRDIEGSNQSLRPDAHSLQARHSNKWDISS